MRLLVFTIFMVCLSVLSYSSSAQGLGFCENRGFYLGGKIIPQLSWMFNNDDSDNPRYNLLTKAGKGFGISAGYNFGDNKGLQLDVLYQMQGKRYKLNDAEYDQDIHYLKLPAYFTFSSKPARIMFLGKIGSQLGILTYAKETLVQSTVDYYSCVNTERFHKVEVGAVLSLGGRCNIARNMWLEAAFRVDGSYLNVENIYHPKYPVGRAETYNLTAGVEIGFMYLISTAYKRSDWKKYDQPLKPTD